MSAGIRITIVTCTVVLALAAGSAGGTFEQQYKESGGDSYGAFGSAVARVPDLDADGIDDILVGSPGAGLARVISGADGSGIHRLDGYGGDDFGMSVGTVDDLDGDHYPDLIVGCPIYDYVKVFSGKDGSEIFTVWGTYGGEYFGFSVAGIGDADGDGRGDFAVGAPYGYDMNWNPTGYVTVYSGKDASTLHTVYGIKYDEFGWSVAGGTDIDGDGCDDYAVGAPTGVNGSAGTTPGYVTIFSGRNGSTITTLYGASDYSRFGSAVALAGDVDGDGSQDLLIGAPNQSAPSGGSGMVKVVSGADGSVIHTLTAASGEASLGASVCGLGDIDGDGADDFAAGGPDTVDSGGNRTGGVRCWSGDSGGDLFSLRGESDGDAFGAALCTLTEASQRGTFGLVAGASGESTGGSGAGSVYLFQDMSLSGKVVVNFGEAYATYPDVMLRLDWISRKYEVRDVRARNVDEEWGDWVMIDWEIPWTLSSGDGVKRVEVEFRDELGTTATAMSKPVFLDTVPPVVSLALAGGAAFTNQTSVGVTLPCSDIGSGPYQARLRNQDGSFGPWFDTGSPPDWALTAGAGLKTVEAECRDRAGNVSELASDSVWVDLTPPTGTMTAEGGATYGVDRNVTLDLSASDEGGSGLTSMRVKHSDTSTWGPWLPYASTTVLLLPPGDGVRGIDAQFGDGAGNLSSVSTDTIFLDATAPTLSSFEVNTGLPCILPGLAIPLEMSALDGTGSGVAAFRVTYDGGSTFSDWLPWSARELLLDHPGLGGEHFLQLMIRDNASNASGLSAPVPLYFVDADCPRLQSGGSFTGSMSSATDIDVVAVDLAKGDVFGMKVKAAAAQKGARFPLVFDIWLEDGTLLAVGIPSLAGYVAPRTGRCYVVARLEGPDPGLGTYTIAASLKLAKANAGIKATVGIGEIEFEATDGSILKGTLRGIALDPAVVQVIGPMGPVAVTATGKIGAAKLSGILDQGSGTYRIQFMAVGPVAVSLGVKLPKGAKFVEP